MSKMLWNTKPTCQYSGFFFYLLKKTNYCEFHLIYKEWGIKMNDIEFIISKYADDTVNCSEINFQWKRI